MSSNEVTLNTLRAPRAKNSTAQTHTHTLWSRSH